MSGILSAFIGRVAGVVTDAYFNLVTLLLPGNGTNGAQNNTFLDSSTNNFTITRNGGNPGMTQGTFSPFSQTGWSNFASATSGSVGFSNSTAALVGSTASTFTAECWIYMTEAPVSGDGVPALIGMDATFNSSIYLGFGPNASRQLVLRWFDGASKTATGGTALALNTWHHIAVVANSNALAMYVNGVAETLSGTTTLTNRNGTTNTFSLFMNSSSSNYQFRGYASNIRVCTSAVYTGAFTPSTSPLTTTSQGATNCKLLTAQDNRFIDNSSNAYVLTLQSTPSVQAFSPFAPTAAYSAATVGGSGYFDGTGDYLATPTAQTNLTLGTSDFTIEGFFYATTQAQTNPALFTSDPGSSLANTILLQMNSSTNALALWVNNVHLTASSTNNSITLNSWNHIAICRSGGSTYSFYINGVAVNNVATNSTSLTTNSWLIGLWYLASHYFTGYISSFRIVKGTAVYTGAFTPPIAPVTTSGPASSYSSTTNVNTTFTSTNTSLLLNFTNAGITDATAKNALETVGNAQISTTQSKFGGSSMYFDGTGDWLSIPASQNLVFGTGAFTIEFWFRIAGSTGTRYNLLGNIGSGDTSIGVYVNTTNALISGTFNNNVAVSSGTVTNNTWYHYALTWDGTTYRQFINGTIDGTSTTARNLSDSTTSWQIGSMPWSSANPLNGYIDDLRITKGYARYVEGTGANAGKMVFNGTNNLALPSTAFPTQ